MPTLSGDLDAQPNEPTPSIPVTALFAENGSWIVPERAVVDVT
jgi:hypothetical protein